MIMINSFTKTKDEHNDRRGHDFEYGYLEQFLIGLVFIIALPIIIPITIYRIIKK